MGDFDSIDAYDSDDVSSRDSWAWLDTPEWVWLTNLPSIDNYVKYENKYGRENVKWDAKAYTCDKTLIPGYISVLVRRGPYEAALASGKGVLPND